MLGDIDRYKKPIEPQIFLAKPNREIIGKLSESYNIKQDIRLISISEITFNLPYEIEENHQLVKNRNIEKLKENYLLKIVSGNKVEWSIIKKLNDGMENIDYKSVTAHSLAYQLRDKILKSYSVDSYYASQVLNDVLSETLWSVGVIDSAFDLTHRAFDFPNNSVLEAVFKIAETFNAIIDWDTENRKVNLIRPELHGLNKGLKFSYTHYLKTLGRESNADEMITRLNPSGKDGLGIQRVNPSGQEYIQDFSYFIFPFERDTSNNVLQSSYYMTDSLCHAILDYDKLLESKKGEFDSLLSNKEVLKSSLSDKNTEMFTLKNEEAQITENMIAQQFNEDMWFNKFNYNGTTVTDTTALDSFKSHAVMCKVASTPNVIIKLDGIQKNVVANQWVLLGKITSSGSTTVEVSGTASNVEVFTQIAYITTIEYNNTLNDNEIINKYSLDHKIMQINAKQLEIDQILSDISLIDVDIDAIRILLSIESNFTTTEINELTEYIIVRDYNNENHINDQELYDDSLDKFKELQKPQMSITLDIVNFLEIVEEQSNWDKLVLGDKVIIEYEKINTKVSAKIIEISYDYEESNINLTIANTKDIRDEDKKLDDHLTKAINTSTTVSMEKNRWGKAVTDTSAMSTLFENIWNNTTNEINIASNETVVIDRKGLTIYDPDDPLRFLRATHGALALTRSGGLRYETAITADGIIAERLFGKIILTQRVVIGDDDGIWLTEGAKTTITDRYGREAMKIGLYEEDPDKFGMVVNRYDPVTVDSTNIINKIIIDHEQGLLVQRKNGLNFDNVAWLDLDGYLNAQGAHFIDSLITDGEIVGGTLKIGSGNNVFKADLNGIYLGNDIFSLAPFRVDLSGNAYMNSANIEDSFITNGDIVGASLTVGSGNEVIKLFPNIGLWGGHANFAEAPFSIDMFGNLKLMNGNNKLLIDSALGKIYLDNFDIEGAGTISAEHIIINTVTANDGFIANLTVNGLKTLGQNDTIGTFANHIDIRDNVARWLTSEITARIQATASNGSPLYWTDSSKTAVTTDVTLFPLYILDLNEAEKLKIGFEGSGTSAYPYIKMGEGTGTALRGQARIDKIANAWNYTYYSALNENQRNIFFEDGGLRFRSVDGFLRLEHSSGTQIEINNLGDNIKMTHISGSFIELLANGDVNISASTTGNVNVSGASINLN